VEVLLQISEVIGLDKATYVSMTRNEMWQQNAV